MKIYDNPSKYKWPLIIKRPEVEEEVLTSFVKDVFMQVHQYKDEALINFAKKYDGVKIKKIVLDSNDINSLVKKTDEKLKVAIDDAYKNIYKFHSKKNRKNKKTLTKKGVICWSESRPIKNVGLYVPGGKTPLISTALMLGIPAKISGCRNIVLITPPDKNGSVSPAICYVAKKLNIQNIYVSGGAQAIAALSLGTECIPRVDKIFGPGNQYVTAAKQYAQKYKVAIDMPAGPSEVMVIADQTTNPIFAAADLLSQAEHGSDSQTVLVADNLKTVEKIQTEFQMQILTLPRRKIVEKSLKKSFAIVLDIEQTIEFIDEYAPEHLIISIKKPEMVAANVSNVGSVFIGSYTPESAGDYASGTNHTLPTSGWAKTYSGLSVKDFQKTITYQKITKKGLSNLSRTIRTLAQAEGLEAHARAVEVRLGKETYNVKNR